MYDMVKKNAELFLQKQYAIIEEDQKGFPVKVVAQWRENREKILQSFLQALQKAAEQYRALQAQGAVSALRYIQISWMRTGLRTKSDLYQIDLYDARWYASFAECTVDWTPPVVFQRLAAIDQKLRPAFEQQTAARQYHLDEIIYRAAELLNKCVFLLLPELLPDAVEQAFPGEKNELQVYFGEYLDHSDCIYDRGDVHEVFLDAAGSAV